MPQFRGEQIVPQFSDTHRGPVAEREERGYDGGMMSATEEDPSIHRTLFLCIHAQRTLYSSSMYS